jgi:hypothetical protein
LIFYGGTGIENLILIQFPKSDSIGKKKKGSIRYVGPVIGDGHVVGPNCCPKYYHCGLLRVKVKIIGPGEQILQTTFLGFYK